MNSFEQLTRDAMKKMIEVDIDPLYQRIYTDTYKETWLESVTAKKEKFEDLSMQLNDHKCNKELYSRSENILGILALIEDFGNYLKFAEKMLLYCNCPENRVYSEIDSKNKNKMTFHFKKRANYDTDTDYEIRITFEKSSINKFPKDNIAYSMLIDDSDKQSSITFITIQIIRNYGKQMVNTYKFIYDEHIAFEDDTDELLLRHSLREIVREIYDTYFSILNNIQPKNHSISTFTMINMIENGLYRVKKRGNKIGRLWLRKN